MRTAILVSGRGSNMQALLVAARRPNFPARIVLVLSDVAEADGLRIAARSGVATSIVDRRGLADREAFDRVLDTRLEEHGVQVVCLAGFMRMLSPWFVERWAGRILNIHPSLLPAFRGLDTHARALAAGVRIHGCTVHYVVAELDAGPIVAQAAVPVLPADTPHALAARVLAQEHRLYPMALSLVASGAARLEGGRVVAAAGGDEDAALMVPDPIAPLLGTPA